MLSSPKTNRCGALRPVGVTLGLLAASPQRNRSIRLSVKIPGYAPCDATATQEVPLPVLYGNDRHGGTVAVQVDSTNLKYVRVDFNQSIT